MRALGLTVCLTVAACGDSAKPGSTCTRACPPPGWTTLDLLAGVPGGPGWVDGTLVAAHFSDPWTLASDGQGHLYVADAETIRVIDLAAGSVATLAGVFNQVGGTDGVGAAATFNTPSGLAYANGQLYVADTENDVIRKIDVATATVTTVAGAFQQPGAVDGSGVAASFAELEGLALDGNGNLYVADTDNDEIRVLSLNDGAVTTVAGAARTIGATDGVGADALFNKPRALAIDAAGNLYVADSLNLSVRRVQVATRTVST